MKWSAWYSNGTRYDSETTGWVHLPSTGLQILIHYKDSGRTIYSGGDWYYLRDNKFSYVPSGDWGTDQPIPDIPCKSCIKQGTGMRDAEFEAIYKLAWEHKP